jgi:hypothetical protein
MNSFPHLARWSGVGPMKSDAGPVRGPMLVLRGAGAGPEIPPIPPRPPDRLGAGPGH